MSTGHPVTKRLDFGDHRQMAAHWGAECVASIRRAVATPRPTTIEDLDLLHAVRSARMAWWHACLTVGVRRGGIENTQSTGRASGPQER